MDFCLVETVFSYLIFFSTSGNRLKLVETPKKTLFPLEGSDDLSTEQCFFFLVIDDGN